METLGPTPRKLNKQRIMLGSAYANELAVAIISCYFSLDYLLVLNIVSCKEHGGH
jgi:hypothetical protein